MNLPQKFMCSGFCLILGGKAMQALSSRLVAYVVS
jgi:hypothetical protein